MTVFSNLFGSGGGEASFPIGFPIEVDLNIDETIFNGGGFRSLESNLVALQADYPDLFALYGSIPDISGDRIDTFDTFNGSGNRAPFYDAENDFFLAANTQCAVYKYEGDPLVETLLSADIAPGNYSIISFTKVGSTYVAFVADNDSVTDNERIYTTTDLTASTWTYRGAPFTEFVNAIIELGNYIFVKTYGNGNGYLYVVEKASLADGQALNVNLLTSNILALPAYHEPTGRYIMFRNSGSTILTATDPTDIANFTGFPVQPPVTGNSRAVTTDGDKIYLFYSNSVYVAEDFDSFYVQESTTGITFSEVSSVLKIHDGWIFSSNLNGVHYNINTSVFSGTKEFGYRPQTYLNGIVSVGNTGLNRIASYQSYASDEFLVPARPSEKDGMKKIMKWENV